MSSPPLKKPNVNEFLMSNALAATKRDSQSTSSSSSSPKKRKTLESRNPKTPNSSVIKEIREKSEQPVIDHQKPISNRPIKPQNTLDSKSAQNPLSNSGKLAKKANLIGENDRICSGLKKDAGGFDPKEVASWKKGEKVPFLFMSLAFDTISKEKSKIVKTNIICNMLRTVMDTTPEDLVAVVCLTANEIAPVYEGLELGIRFDTLVKALAETYGSKKDEIIKKNDDLGDLGLVAKESRLSQSILFKPKALTVDKVFDTFKLIAKESGKDSQEKKKNRIKSLLVAATDCEPQYLIGLLQSNLRIGLAEQSLLAALGQAAVYNQRRPSQSAVQEAVGIVKQVYSVCPNYGMIVPALLNNNVCNLPNVCRFTVGLPIGPMLAKAAKTVSDIENKFRGMEITCEYKYDGERAQIHYMENGSVEIYSRNSERYTVKYPDVVAAVSRLKKSSVSSFVLDCEIVAYDRGKQKILPFQILETRNKKNVSSDIKVGVCIYAFDMLYLNGKSLLEEQLKDRREKLYDSFDEEPGFLQFAAAFTPKDPDEILKLLDDAVGASCEGLVIKTLNRDATYEPYPSKRNWLKFKKDYINNIGDSLDLVPIAAFHGCGRRTGVYGSFLLACYNKDNEEFQSICKLGNGMSDSMLEELSSRLRSKVIPKPMSYYRYADAINPAVWFEPTEVWEVKAEKLSISPLYCAAIGLVDLQKGISLRFPVLKRVREDKTPEQASSSEQIAEMYTAQ